MFVTCPIQLHYWAVYSTNRLLYNEDKYQFSVLLCSVWRWYGPYEQLITCRRNHLQDRAVGIVTGLRNERQGVRISAEVRGLSLIQNIHTALGLTKSPIQRVLGFFPETKTPEREVNSFPPTAENKNGWRYTSTPTPALCLYGVIRHKFNFLYFKLSPCSECGILTFGWFPGVWILCADVSKHTICSIFIGCVYRKKELLTPPMKMEQTECFETSA
jgi:hypothetical protein